MTISLWGTAKNSLSAAIAASTALAMPACAGPPFETDDPAPTDMRHWEVYLFADAGGRGAEFDGSGGVDVNYGPVEGVQLTTTLPLHISSEGAADITVRDVDLSVKYRFLKRRGWSAAVAPILTVPLLAEDAGSRRLDLRLPLWIGWDEGRDDGGGWSIFGGGGPAFQEEREGRDHWFGGLVVTHGLAGQARIGLEMTRRGRDGMDTPGETGMDAGCIVPLTGPLVFHAAIGPRFVDGEAMRYRFYLAMMAQF